MSIRFSREPEMYLCVALGHIHVAMLNTSTNVIELSLDMQL